MQLIGWVPECPQVRVTEAVLPASCASHTMVIVPFYYFQVCTWKQNLHLHQMHFQQRPRKRKATVCSAPGVLGPVWPRSLGMDTHEWAWLGSVLRWHPGPLFPGVLVLSFLLQGIQLLTFQTCPLIRQSDTGSILRGNLRKEPMVSAKQVRDELKSPGVWVSHWVSCSGAHEYSCSLAPECGSCLQLCKGKLSPPSLFELLGPPCPAVCEVSDKCGDKG